MTARSEIDERLLDEALAWHRDLVRDDADWDGYTRWLEADPLHREAFDAVALTDRIVDDHRDDLLKAHPAPLAAVEARRARSLTRRVWLQGSLAAALALAIGVPTLWHGRQAPDIVYATMRGETQRISLPKGIAVDLSPSTRLILKNGDPTRMELAGGDAFFEVTHDPGRALSIKAGEYSVRDIGTAFGVNLSTAAVAVAVAEGHVSIVPESGQATRVSAGQQLIARRGGHAAQVSPVETGNVGSWRNGRLVYNNAPLNIVAADIARYSGKAVTVDPAIGERPFSGVLVIGDGSGLLANLSALMAISYKEEGDSVRISADSVR